MFNPLCLNGNLPIHLLTYYSQISGPSLHVKANDILVPKSNVLFSVFLTCPLQLVSVLFIKLSSLLVYIKPPSWFSLFPFSSVILGPNCWFLFFACLFKYGFINVIFLVLPVFFLLMS